MKTIDIVFSGSGVRLIAFTGALKRLEEVGVQFRNIAGTSGGALIGALLAAGYTADELTSLVMGLNFTTLHRTNWKIWEGYDTGAKAELYIKHLLDKKHVSTFQKLQGRLQIVATDITTNSVRAFGQPVKDDRMPVAYAVRLSMSIPFYYTCLNWHGDYYDDGGLRANYPINLFDQQRDAPTLGLKIHDPEAFSPNEIYGGFNLVKRFTSLQRARLNTLLHAQDNLHVHGADWVNRTVAINGLGISAIQMKLTLQEKTQLFESGYKAANDFLATHPLFFTSGSSAILG